MFTPMAVFAYVYSDTVMVVVNALYFMKICVSVTCFFEKNVFLSFYFVLLFNFSNFAREKKTETGREVRIDRQSDG